MTMSNGSEALGVCPECGTEIRASQILVEYTTADGATERFADCYSCETVVHPE
jgi:formate dehydrogenase maturation protein FdhE